MAPAQESVGSERKTGELPALDARLTTTERAALDARVLAGEPIAPDALKTVLRGPAPSPELKRAYADMLLRHALDARESESAVLVAGLMDRDPDLDAALNEVLNQRLDVAPDEVYAFIRARLAEGLDPRWLVRLKDAARCALDVALTDGDSETTLNWLKLISREPSSYELGDLLHKSLLAAAERAYADGELGRGLLSLAVRRDPAAFETLLADPALLATVANNMGRVLRDYDGDIMTTLQNNGPEMFLVGLARAARARRPAMFTPAAVEQVWTLYTGAPTNVAPQYAADKIVGAWLEDGASWLDEPALQTALTLALRDRRDDLFARLAHPLVGRDNFPALIGVAFQKSTRPEADVNTLITQMMTAGDLTPQLAVDTYLRVLNGGDWRKAGLPLTQQLMRLLNQHPTLTTPPQAMWKALDVAADTKDEGIARVAVRRLTVELEAIEDEAAFAEALVELHDGVQWNATTRQFLVGWWRGYVHATALARLQRLDKAFDGKRSLDDLRTILQTVIAFRKLLGKRNLQQFAWDVGVAYGILQAFMEAFDPSPRRAAGFDQTTLRAELEARSGDLTPHEQQILANNFKELAQLIAAMGDNRSKASLMRRGDDVDRQLMTGDQQPHSAVDTLKWLSGYMSGSQEKDEQDEE